MAGETILVVDAGQDVNQRMITTLEGESYLVYPVSSQEVNAEMAELLGPSLIYIKPSDLSPTGLDPCKAIHGIPLLIKVPIVILASLKKALGPSSAGDWHCDSPGDCRRRFYGLSAFHANPEGSVFSGNKSSRASSICSS